MALRWYVVHAYSNFEHKVAEALQDRVKMRGLEHKFGEVLVPTEEVVEMRDGQKRKSDRKFFPGYVLVQMEMDEDTWHLVKEVPKVLGFIGGTPDRPAPITDKEANAILRRVEEGAEKPKPKVLFEPGEVVRVTTARSTTSTASSRTSTTRRAGCRWPCRSSGARRRSSWTSRRSRRPDSWSGFARAEPTSKGATEGRRAKAPVPRRSRQTRGSSTRSARTPRGDGKWLRR
jgi:transcription termination/antitermination protein NusG